MVGGRFLPPVAQTHAFSRFFARGVRKQPCVLRSFVAFAVRECQLGTIKKPRVLRAFAVQGVPRNGENDLSTSGKCLETMEQPKAKIRPT